MPKSKKPVPADRMQALWALIHAQAGLLATWQALQHGVSGALLTNWVKERSFRRVMHGIYLAPGITLDDRLRAKATVLALRGPRSRNVALSHHAAAFVWGLIPKLPKVIDVVVGSSRHPSRAGIRVHRLTALEFDLDVVVRQSVPVLSMERTLCALAAVCTVAELCKHIATAQRKRFTTPAQLAVVAESLGPFAGKRTMTLALQQMRRKGWTHSELEALGRRLLALRGHTPFPRPLSVFDDGREIAEVDIPFCDERVAIAIDGPHHQQDDQRRFDEDQRQALEALGWIVIRADEVRLTRQPSLFVKQVEDALARRRAATAQIG